MTEIVDSYRPEYTHAFPDRGLLLRVFKNGSVQAIRCDGSVYPATPDEILTMQRERETFLETS